jgi:hypothetical protein
MQLVSLNKLRYNKNMRGLALAVMATLFLVAGVSAQAPSVGGGVDIPIPNPLGCERVDCVLNQVLRVLLALATPITTLMVLVGAFQILTAGGNPEKFKRGRQTILYAAIGFAVVLLASSVSYLLNSLLSS